MYDDYNEYDIDNDEVTDYWMSYSDMMSALLLMFVLLLTISMMHFNENSATLKEQKDQLVMQEKRIESIIGVRRDIVDKLKQQFSESELEIKIDSQTGAITFSDGIFFDVNKNNIKKTGKDNLKKFIPQYIGVLLDDMTRQYVSQIIIEGHTDTNGTYMYNLDLSQKRALEVTKYILGDGFEVISKEEKENLRNILTANGRSFSQVIKDNNGNVDMAKSRRVEFKFRLKDEEMIGEMNRILKGE